MTDLLNQSSAFWLWLFILYAAFSVVSFIDYLNATAYVKSFSVWCIEFDVKNDWFIEQSAFWLWQFMLYAVFSAASFICRTELATEITWFVS